MYIWRKFVYIDIKIKKRVEKIKEYCKNNDIEFLTFTDGICSFKCRDCGKILNKKLKEIVFTKNYILKNFLCSICWDKVVTRKRHERIANTQGYILDIEKGSKEVNKDIVHVKCSEGHEFTTSWKKPKVCPQCKEKRSKERSLECIHKNVGDYKLIKIHPKKDGHTTLTLQCDKGHIFERTSCNAKRYIWCPECYRKNFLEVKQEEVVKNLEDHNFKLLSEYINATTPIKVQCSKGHVFEILYNYFITHFKCSICERYTSSYETELCELLKSWGIKNIERKCKYILSPYEVDIYLPDYQLGIEFHGLFFHSYEHKLNDFQGDNKKAIEYHKIKVDKAEEKNIRLIQIFEDEWLNNKDKVIGILKRSLNIVDKRVFARKCVVKEVSYKEAKDFLDKYHIGGSGLVGKIRLGLYECDELFALLTFLDNKKSSKFKKEDGTFELYKFVTSKKVIGGLSRLLSHFIKRYSPLKIISYIDRRFFTGGGFREIGFKLDSVTPPNYYYFRPGKFQRIHRFNLRKTWKGPPTEKQRRFEEGYRRIYDAGHLKLIYELK